MEQPVHTPAQAVDWRAVQADYEMSRMPIRIIAAQYGVHPSAINRRVRKENWKRRQTTYAIRSAEDRITHMIETVKLAIVRKLTTLGNRVEPPDRIDTEDPVKAMTALTTALKKIIDIQYKDNHGDGGGGTEPFVIDDVTRSELAQRLEQLGQEWRAARIDPPA